MLEERLAVARGEADPERLGRGLVEAPLGQELPGGQRVGRGQLLGVVELRDLVRLDQPAALGTLGPIVASTEDDVLPTQHHAVLLGEALDSGRLHAAIDVADTEPLPEDHALWDAPNLLISPHVGGASSAMWPRAHRLVRDQLRRYAAGEELANIMSGDY